MDGCGWVGGCMCVCESALSNVVGACMRVHTYIHTYVRQYF